MSVGFIFLPNNRDRSDRSTAQHIVSLIDHNGCNLNQNDGNGVPGPGILKRSYSYYGIVGFKPELYHELQVVRSLFKQLSVTGNMLAEAIVYLSVQHPELCKVFRTIIRLSMADISILVQHKAVMGVLIGAKYVQVNPFQAYSPIGYVWDAVNEHNLMVQRRQFNTCT